MIRSSPNGRLLKLKLARDLVRSIKRGHPWVFADALVERPKAPAGAHAALFDTQGREVAKGFYDPESPIAFRACVLESKIELDNAWAIDQLRRAVELRKAVMSADTTGYRLINGEGDGMPGLVCDVYGEAAVLQFDGEGPLGFWDAPAIARRLAELLSLQCVYHKFRNRKDEASGESLIGDSPRAPVEFCEHGAKFTADIVHGQKTGFFLDQRENRQRIRAIAHGRKTLNMFGYTGGFSVCAGLGGARHVITVDIAPAALEVADRHWGLNDLDRQRHQTVVADAFEFLEAAKEKNDRWDLVILDPPSFAPSRKAVGAAIASYQKLIAAGAAVTERAGLVAAASCSSHVTMEHFLAACEEGVSDARRRATVLGVHGQPLDHPSPLALPELRYLKFVLLRVE